MNKQRDIVSDWLIAIPLALFIGGAISVTYNSVTHDWTHEKAMKREMFKRCWNGTKPIMWSCKVGDLI